MSGRENVVARGESKNNLARRMWGSPRPNASILDNLKTGAVPGSFVYHFTVNRQRENEHTPAWIVAFGYGGILTAEACRLYAEGAIGYLIYRLV